MAWCSVGVRFGDLRRTWSLGDVDPEEARSQQGPFGHGARPLPASGDVFRRVGRIRRVGAGSGGPDQLSLPTAPIACSPHPKEPVTAW